MHGHTPHSQAGRESGEEQLACSPVLSRPGHCLVRLPLALKIEEDPGAEFILMNMLPTETELNRRPGTIHAVQTKCIEVSTQEEDQLRSAILVESKSSVGGAGHMNRYYCHLNITRGSHNSAI